MTAALYTLAILGAAVQRFEGREERRAGVPRHFGRSVDDVISVDGGDRNEMELWSADLRSGGARFFDNFPKGRFGIADEVHFIHADDESADAEKRSDREMAFRLFHQPVAGEICGVNQHDDGVDRRAPGDHVPRILEVARTVDDDELSVRGREIPIRDIDRDSLFALRAEPVGEKGEV